MPRRRFRSPLLLVTVVLACGRDTTSLLSPITSRAAGNASNATVDVCHLSSNGVGNINGISANALDAHIAHGDYVARLIVNQSATTGDGVHFKRVSDAVGAADSVRRAHGERRAGKCRITIDVASGIYLGSFTVASASLERLPLLLVVPDVTLTGAYSMQLDASGRAIGSSNGGASAIVPDEGMGGNDALVVVGADSAGFRGDGVTVQGFRFTSGFDTLGTTSGGVGVGASVVRALTITGNKFDPTLNSSVDLRGSQATVTRNHGRKLAICGICLGGPGRYDVSDNRVLDGAFTALFAAPIVIRPMFTATLYPLVEMQSVGASAVTADTTTITNNDFSEHVRHPRGFGSGVRLVSFSSDASAATQQSVITLRGNRFYHNSFAIDVDANTPPTPAPGIAEFGLTLDTNAVGPSCRNNLLVSFSRISRSLSTGTESYLNHSRYTLTLNGNTPWSNAWFDNSLGVDDHLFVDGTEIPAGKKVSPSDNPAGC